MSKDYQKTARTNTTVESPAPVAPDAVHVAISEIAPDGPQDGWPSPRLRDCS